MTRAIIRRWGPGKLAAVPFVLALAFAAHGESKPPAAPAPPAATPPVPSATPAPAAPSGARSRAKPARIDEAALAADLARPDTIAAALAAIQAAGPAAKKLAPAVEALLARGLPPDLAARAIASLGAAGSETSSAVIAPYTSHRSAPVRRAATEALGNTRGPRAAATLATGLRSSDGAVRSLSAKALRFAGSSENVPELLRAFDRGEPSAAPSIAALCAADQCAALLVRWDRIAAGAQGDVLEALLARRPALPDDVLLQALARVRASESASAKTYLQSAKKNLALSPRVRKAIEAASRGSESKP